jgi:ABC-type branched-subunit amino acid transport system ATPase component
MIHSLIGPNDVVKTTFVNIVTDMLPETERRVYYEGLDIVDVQHHLIAIMGLSCTFQRGQTFVEGG